MALKRGWLKCQMSENSACVDRRSLGLQRWCHLQHGSPAEMPWWTWTGANAGERHPNPRRHPLLLVRVSTGNPDILREIPGTQNNSSRCPHHRASLLNTIRPPAHGSHFAFLFAGIVPCMNARREQELQAGFLLQRHEITGGSWRDSSHLQQACCTVNLQCPASFRGRSILVVTCLDEARSPPLHRYRRNAVLNSARWFLQPEWYFLVGRHECIGDGGQKSEERFFLTVKLPGLEQGMSKFSTPPPPRKEKARNVLFKKKKNTKAIITLTNLWSHWMSYQIKVVF